jgi:DTW domain-containing protein YfiP
MRTEPLDNIATSAQRPVPGTPDIPAGCVLCRLPVRWCICCYAPKINIPSSLTLLVHSIEWRKSSNTGHLIRSVAPHWQVLIQGKPHHRLSDAEIFRTEKKPYILFPGHGARKVSEIPPEDRERGIHLIIPDGNWRQTSHMLKRIAPLHGIPTVMLSNAAPEHRRMRVNISPERMSTFEAVVLALAELDQFGGDLHAPAQLLHFFRLYADRMLMLRGKLKAGDIEKPMQNWNVMPS